MTPQVIAVIGACAPERRSFAERIADQRWAQLVPAQQIEQDPTAAEKVLQQVSQSTQPGSVVLEYPLQNPALHIIGELADITTAGELTELVCLVDAVHLLSDLGSSEEVQLADYGHDAEAVYASRAELMVTQIEYASTVVLVNTEAMSAYELNRVLALISHLSPKAHLDLAEPTGYRRPRPGLGGFTMEQTSAGWVSLLNGDFAPRFQDTSVVALRYEQLRPFHPERLDALMRQLLKHHAAGLLLRSAGFCHLATRGHITAHWNHVGSRLSLFPAAFDHQYGAEDEPLAFGQDLALIGIDLDPQKIIAGLDAAALTDQELTGGPGLWATFTDPFPEWSTADR